MQHYSIIYIYKLVKGILKIAFCKGNALLNFVRECLRSASLPSLSNIPA